MDQDSLLTGWAAPLSQDKTHCKQLHIYHVACQKLLGEAQMKEGYLGCFLELQFFLSYYFF